MSEPRFLFESWRGRYADSPRSISEHLADAWPSARRTWVSTGDPAAFPADVRTVRRHSARYFADLLRTDVLMANDIISQHRVKGPGVTYVQLWHGTPLKLIGYDERAHAYSGAQAHLQRMARDVAKWDYLVSPSPTCTGLFRSAFGYDGPVWETGYPRNDVLSSDAAPEIRARTRAALGLAPDALVVLHAPTWRDDDKDADGRFRQSVLPDRSVRPPTSSPTRCRTSRVTGPRTRIPTTPSSSGSAPTRTGTRGSGSWSWSGQPSSAESSNDDDASRHDGRRPIWRVSASSYGSKCRQSRARSSGARGTPGRALVCSTCSGRHLGSSSHVRSRSNSACGSAKNRSASTMNTRCSPTAACSRVICSLYRPRARYAWCRCSKLW